MPNIYKEKCPKGGEHDFDILAHSSGDLLPVVGTILMCVKCGKKDGKMIDKRTGKVIE